MKKKAIRARYIAIEILCRWEESHMPLDQVLEQHVADLILNDPRDRRLVMSLVYGAVRWRGYLDWVVEKFSNHPLPKIKIRTLQALRIGILQLLFLDRIPASAAVNETVQALKEMKQPKWLTGFVNGLLRRVDRERHSIDHPLYTENVDTIPPAALLSHPAWLMERWHKRYGALEMTKICRANNAEPPLCLQVNITLTTPAALLEKLRSKGLHAEPGPHSALAVRLYDFHGPIKTIPGFAEGLFQVQDEAAQLISLLPGPLQSGKSYLDGCAGLGGKTSNLAQILPSGSKLTAIEPNSGRIKKLNENLGRLQLESAVTIVEGTLDTLLPGNKEKFAGILIDAPCSGLGVIRRHPDIRWNRDPGDLLGYQEKQLDLLNDAAQLAAPNGIIVYATCSTEPEENDAVIQKFLTDHPRFALSSCREVLPENEKNLVDDQGFFRTRPGQDDLDGFFAARLMKM